MYAPVVTRFLSYDVPLDRNSVAYCKRAMELPAMKEWVAAAKKEPDEIDELDAEFKLSFPRRRVRDRTHRFDIDGLEVRR